MAAADIFRALGAALQTGVGTFGALSEQEREQKLREEQLATQQKNADRQYEIDSRRVAGDEQDRKLRMLMAAIEGTQPGQSVSPELFQRAQEMGLEDRFKTIEAGTPVSGGGGGPFAGITIPTMKPTHHRTPTLQETAAMKDMRREDDADTNRKIFQTWLAGEGANADHDTRVAKAASLGQQAPGISLREKRAEEDRARAADHQNRMQELTVMYPPDRFGADGKVGQSRASIWDRNYNAIATHVRAKYSAELGQVARAIAEGTAPPESLDAIRQRIDTEVDALMKSRFGERPLDTDDRIREIDSDAQRAGGFWNFFRIAKAPASIADLRARGVDVQRYLTEVKKKADAEAAAYHAGRR